MRTEEYIIDIRHEGNDYIVVVEVDTSFDDEHHTDFELNYRVQQFVETDTDLNGNSFQIDMKSTPEEEVGEHNFTDWVIEHIESESQALREMRDDRI